MNRLHSVHSGFGEQNLPLQLLLGLLSATGRVAHLLPEPEPQAEPHSAEPSPPPDAFAALLLGVVSFRRALLEVLSAARTEPAAPESPVASPGSPRDLLR